MAFKSDPGSELCPQLLAVFLFLQVLSLVLYLGDPFRTQQLNFSQSFLKFSYQSSSSSDGLRTVFSGHQYYVPAVYFKVDQLFWKSFLRHVQSSELVSEGCEQHPSITLSLLEIHNTHCKQCCSASLSKFLRFLLGL